MLKNQSGPIEPTGVDTAGDLRAQGVETILLVEDEDSVRAIVRKILERYGYAVLESREPDHAIAVVAAQDAASHIHLLLTDIVMPGMDGQALSRRIAELRPDLRVLFMSGYADSPDRYSIDRRRFIQKPFTPAGLARKVREAIDARDWS